MTTTLDNFNAFVAAENTLSTCAPNTLSGRGVYKFNPPQAVTRIPLHVRTGPIRVGQLTERYKFQQIEFHGKGTLFIRVYVDGVWICEGDVTLTETPSKDRRLGLPTGTRGYILDLEFCGDADIRAIEFNAAPMARPS